jgi:hypothetical protein
MFQAVKFNAVGTKENGEQYDCSFVVTLDLKQRPTQPQIDHAIAFAHKQFLEYHPTGKVIGQQNAMRH